MSTETPVLETPAAGVQPGVTPAAAGTETPAVAAGQPEATPEAGTPAPVAGPPETYALTVADDGVVTAEGLKAFEEEARTLGLTNEAAQAHLNRRIDAFYAQSDADIAAVEADPTYGGAKLAETQRLAESALNRFAPKGTTHGDAIRDLLRGSGRGNALPIVAFMAEIGRAAQEDRPVTGGNNVPAEKPKSDAEVFYPPETAAQ